MWNHCQCTCYILTEELQKSRHCTNRAEWKTLIFSNPFGLQDFLVIHKTKINGEIFFSLNQREASPEAFIVPHILLKIQLIQLIWPKNDIFCIFNAFFQIFYSNMIHRWNQQIFLEFLRHLKAKSIFFPENFPKGTAFGFLVKCAEQWKLPFDSENFFFTIDLSFVNYQKIL